MYIDGFTPTTAEEEAAKGCAVMCRRLESPFKAAIAKAKPAIDDHEFGLIVGDDASGRLPTLVFRSFLREIYQDSGDGFVTTFIQGAGRNGSRSYRRDYKKRVEDHVESRLYKPLLDRNLLGKRALIVTDGVTTGRGLSPMIDALDQMGLEPSVMSLGVVDNQILYLATRLVLGWRTRLYSSSDCNAGIAVQDKNEIAGVSKSYDGIISQPYRYSNRAFVNASRSETALLGHRLAEWYDAIGS